MCCGVVGAFNRVYEDFDTLIAAYDLPYERVEADRLRLVEALARRLPEAALNRLVQHLLEVSRFRPGNAELHRSCFDLVPLVGEVAAWFAEREEAYRAAGIIGSVGGSSASMSSG